MVATVPFKTSLGRPVRARCWPPRFPALLNPRSLADCVFLAPTLIRSVESVGVYKPEELLSEAVKTLKAKAETLLAALREESESEGEEDGEEDEDASMADE